MSDETYADVDLEAKLLSHFTRFDNSLLLRLDFFTCDEARELFKFHQKQRGLSISTIDDWWDLWSVDLKRKQLSLPTHQKYLQRVWAEDEIQLEQVEYFVTQLRGFAEARELVNVYRTSLESFKTGDVVEAKKHLEDGLEKLTTQFPSGSIYRADFVDNFTVRYEEYKKRQRGESVSKIPTGIRKLDKYIKGIVKPSLNFIQGETNVGKTWLLQELAFQAFMKGMRVVFVTVEMPGIEIERRWDSRITGISSDKFDDGILTEKEEKWWLKRMRDLDEVKKKKGSRLVQSFLPEGCTISAIEAEVIYWENVWGNKIDMLVLDYVDLMESTRRVYSEQEQQGAVMRDMKRFTQTHGCIGWTVTQTAGRSYGKKYLDMGDTGYSKKKAMWGNLILGASADEDDMDEGIINISVLKNTHGPKNFHFEIYPDFSIGKIDVDREPEGTEPQ